MARKTRTREHIIADYSGIHFERYALECGYSVERITHDYGIDLVMYTYNKSGEIESGSVLDADAIRRFAQWKNAERQRLRGARKDD